MIHAKTIILAKTYTTNLGIFSKEGLEVLINQTIESVRDKM